LNLGGGEKKNIDAGATSSKKDFRTEPRKKLITGVRRKRAKNLSRERCNRGNHVVEKEG